MAMVLVWRDRWPFWPSARLRPLPVVPANRAPAHLAPLFHPVILLHAERNGYCAAVRQKARPGITTVRAGCGPSASPPVTGRGLAEQHSRYFLLEHELRGMPGSGPGRSQVHRRGLGGLRESTWPRIADIGLRPYGRTVTIMVTAAAGGRFRLAAPVADGVMAAPDSPARPSRSCPTGGRRPSGRPRAVTRPRSARSSRVSPTGPRARPRSARGRASHWPAADHGTGASTGPGGSASP